MYKFLLNYSACPHFLSDILVKWQVFILNMPKVLKKKRSVYIQVILVSPVYLTAIRKMPDCRRLCWESAKIGAATIMIFVTFTRIWWDGSDAEALGFTRSQLQQHCSATTVMLHRVVLRSVHTRMCMNIIGSNHLISFFKIINKILTAQRNH